VSLPGGPPSAYQLRASPRVDGVCTFEAIARALGIIEGGTVQRQMEEFFHIFVERVLYIRGRKWAGRICN